MACAALSSLLLIKWREISSALLSGLNLMSVIQIVLLELCWEYEEVSNGEEYSR